MAPRSQATTADYVTAMLVALAAKSAGAECVAAVSCTCESVRDRVLLRAGAST
jgi:hypothetical protein